MTNENKFLVVTKSLILLGMSMLFASAVVMICGLYDQALWILNVAVSLGIANLVWIYPLGHWFFPPQDRMPQRT